MELCSPGHDGYQRASDLINGTARNGQMGNQIWDAPVRPFLHLSIRLADLGGIFYKISYS